eukprot:GHVS01095463.1.p1 GENE.GHVS01095463.1~~GHVS01095463.1.p1  ORF type:complete len:434 (+),score=99.27 GHVS01095463.1:388-1689(+)
MARLLGVAICSCFLLVLAPFVSCQVRGVIEKALRVVDLKKAESIIDPFGLLPFSDTSCFIEEYAGLIGAMYDTEQFDREKAKAIIADYLRPIGLQSEVAKMLYLSMRELVPILALEAVPEAVFTAFESRIAAQCNNQRRLQDVFPTADVEEELVEGSEVFANTPEELAAVQTESSEWTDEEAFYKEAEVVVDVAALGGDVEGLDVAEAFEGLDAVVNSGDENVKEEQAMAAEGEVFPAEFPLEEEELFEAGAATDESLAVAGGDGKESVKLPERFSSLGEAVSVGNLQAVYDSLRTSGNAEMNNFLEEAVGSDFKFTEAVPSQFRGGAGVGGGVLRGQGKRSCSFLNEIDNHCFVVQYAGFVGESWGTRTFDEDKAVFILDTLPLPKLVATVASVLCLGAETVMPVFSGDASITTEAIDEFFLAVPALCPLIQ